MEPLTGQLNAVLYKFYTPGVHHVHHVHHVMFQGWRQQGAGAHAAALDAAVVHMAFPSKVLRGGRSSNSSSGGGGACRCAVACCCARRLCWCMQL